VSENGGDIIYTQKFDVYQQTEPFEIYMCRGADPESKGKIENVIGFIKNNFAKNRLFHDLERWNKDALQWLVRKGNGKQHNTTKKVPSVVFEEEKKHLLLDLSRRLKTNADTVIARRMVRKDNTIMYEANRYSVPLGTYQAHGVDVDVYATDDEVTIMNTETGEVIAKHTMSPLKGKLIQATQHKRNRTLGIDQMADEVIKCFDNEAEATQFVNELRRRYPRYIRDQLQIMSEFAQCHTREEITDSLGLCIDLGLYSANDLRDAHKSLYHKPHIEHEQDMENPPVGYYSPETERKLAHIQTETRNLEIYTKMMEVRTDVKD
jgi:hypothetical protein